MIGIDLVHIATFARQLEHGGDGFLNRAFHPHEQRNAEPTHLAGLWAAKEAILKAAGLQPGQWLDIVITHAGGGRPLAQVGERQFDISIAHHGDYAVAVAQEHAGA